MKVATIYSTLVTPVKYVGDPTPVSCPLHKMPPSQFVLVATSAKRLTVELDGN